MVTEIKEELHCLIQMGAMPSDGSVTLNRPTAQGFRCTMGKWGNNTTGYWVVLRSKGMNTHELFGRVTI